MDGKMNKADGSDGTGSHIWLRYATQFTMNGRSVTVEMGIPVPLGASAETRERLIREAEEGMEQLSNHIEGRIGQMVQRIQQAPTAKQSATRPANTPTTTATPPAVAPAPAPKPPRPAQPTQPTQSTQSTQPIQLVPNRENAPAASQEKEVPSTPPRTNVGASMPGTGDTGGNLSLPQFIQIIRESLNLTPKQAMDLLKVKSLSGLNYRTALEDLQSAISSESADAPESPEPPLKLREETPSRGSERPATNTGTRNTTSQSQSPAPVSNIVPISKKVPYEEITHAVIRETPPTYSPAFDEELDDTDIEFEDEPEYPQLTQHEREIAEEVLKRLKEAQGSSVASPSRLTVLNNVIGGQISDEQLQQLIQGVWKVNSTKKLKNEQVEALVYWGKDDNFIEEVELVLALLEEGDYARSDR
jgi:hypothetical protein